MRALRNLLTDATDKRFRTAVLLGIASIPFTVGANWLLMSDTVEGTPLFVACVISGYLYGSRVESPVHAGTLTGLVGGAPVFVLESSATLVEFWGNPTVTDIIGASIGMAAVSVLAALLTAGIWVVILLVIGALGGLIGGWINGRIGSSGPIPSRS